MKFLRKFNEHTSYEAELNVGGQNFEIPNVSYCKNVDDVHFNPYNLIEFYVGNITGTTPQTVKIYTDTTNFDEVIVSEGNKWYTYVLPKDKGLCWINGDSVKKVTIKANISYKSNFNPPHNFGKTIIPSSTVEASFKGSNTSGVTDMVKMFNFCSGLTSLDVSNFDTSNVTDMFYMFYGCSGLTSLDLSKWDTSKVTRMNQMFSYCDGLTSLDLSGWDTSNVTLMDSMFYNCISLTSLDLRNFNTSNVTLMDSMFYNCRSLTSLDLSKWNTSKVNNMNNMFNGCSGLTSLNLSKWNISEGTIITNMFRECNALKTIIMKGCSEATINKVTSVKPSSATTIVTE